VLLRQCCCACSLPLPDTSCTGFMLTGCKTALRDCTAQPKAFPHAGQLPEGLVLAKTEVATNSAGILQLRASAHINKIKNQFCILPAMRRWSKPQLATLVSGSIVWPQRLCSTVALYSSGLKESNHTIGMLKLEAA
jgi:hypothetical protein